MIITKLPIQSTIDEEEKLIKIFTIVDDFVIELNKYFLPTSHLGRKNKLNVSELITVAIYFLYSDVNSFKSYVRLFNTNKYFKLPEYSRLLKLVKEITPIALIILKAILLINKKNSKKLIKIIDTLPLPVCKNKRIFSYRVAPLASRGVSSIGYYYGFKLHIVCDVNGQLLSIKLTPANVSDKNHEIVMDLLKDIEGVVIGDTGYLSSELTQKLKDKKIDFITGVKKNMKKLISKSKLKLLKSRQIIETVNSVVKYRMSSVTSLARSLNGYLWRYYFAILTYAILCMI